MFWHKFPYTDAHELNLDYILAMIREMHKEISEFEAVNKITNAGAWDITKQYQAWTIVSDNNMGYISLQPVPAGVAITNTDYWGLVADYDILITNLSQRISDLEADNVVNKANISKLKSKNGDIDFMIMLTDSFGENVTPNISTLVPSYLGLDATQHYAHARGGCGFGSSCPYNYLTELQGIESAIAGVVDDNDVKTILVTGGSNDVGYGDPLTDIIGSISAFMTYCGAKYPNARVFFAFTGWTLVYSSANWNPNRFKDVLGAWEHVTMYGGFILHNINAVMHIKSFFNGDDIHPTIVAQHELSRAIANGLITGSAEIHVETSATLTAQTGFTLGGTWAVNERVDNEIVTCRMTGTGNAPYPNIAMTSLAIVNGFNEPPINWFAKLSDYAMGNVGSYYLNAAYIGLFVSTEYTGFVPIKIFRQDDNIGFAAALPAGTYTNVTVYLPNALDIVCATVDC